MRTRVLGYLSINDMVRREFASITIKVETDLVLGCDFCSFSRVRTGFLCDYSSRIPYSNFFHSIWPAPTTLPPFYVLQQNEVGMHAVAQLVSMASCRRCLPYSSIFVLMVLLFSSNTHPMNPTINCSGDNSLYSGKVPPALGKQ